MANLAARLSDRVILTSDNPRFEDPHEILAQMQAGVTAPDAAKVRTMADRREAIEAAVRWPAPATSCWWRAKATKLTRKSEA